MKKLGSLESIGKDGQICRVKARISSCNAVKYSSNTTKHFLGHLCCRSNLSTARNFQSWR